MIGSMPRRIWIVALVLATAAACRRESDPAAVRVDRTLLPVQVKGKWGYANRLGLLSIGPRFDAAGDFVDGFAHVCLGPCTSESGRTGKHGFIDRKGGWVLNATFDDTHRRFSEGLVAVCTGDCSWEGASGRWGFADTTGTVVIQPQFGNAGDFQEGLAPACAGKCRGLQVNGRWGYIDRTGGWKIMPRFSAAEPFYQGVARVEIDGKQGYIDKKGKFLFAPSS
jgi:hypothetical protein